jgi:hypothetical protein
MPLLPVLHIGDTLVEVTVLDPRAVALGALVLAGAIAVIWAPRTGLGSPLSPGIRRLSHALLGALVFLAIAPHIVPYDHLLSDTTGHAEVHAAHCHGTAADCADAPVPSGPGQFLTSTPLLLAPALLSVLLVITLVPLTGTTRTPELRPPVRTASA